MVGGICVCCTREERRVVEGEPKSSRKYGDLDVKRSVRILKGLPVGPMSKVVMEAEGMMWLLYCSALIFYCH